MSKQSSRAERDAAVRAVVIGGESQRTVGARFGVSPTTIRTWVDQARAEAEREDTPEPRKPVGSVRDEERRFASLIRDPEPSASPKPRTPRPETDGKTTLEQARAAWQRAQDLADNAEQSGNYQAAQRSMRDAMSYMLIIARLEKEAATTGDDVRIPRAEIEPTRARLLAQIAAACERPLLCAECSRKLSIDWGMSGPPVGMGGK